jgi:hypothetical protein
MERFWRGLADVLTTKRWIVVAVMLVITAVLAIGLTRVEFATGQDSYLNPSSQIALDNVEFQNSFGGEQVILLFTATEPDVDVSHLFEGDNLAELTALTERLEAVDEAFAVLTPLTTLTFSSSLISEGVASSALIAGASRDPDPDGQAARQADIPLALARLGGAGEERIGNPEWNELLLFGNDGYALDGEGAVVTPPVAERAIRLSLLSSFPNLQTAVGGVVLTGNASIEELSVGTDAVLAAVEGAEFDGFDLTVTGVPLYLKDINEYLQGGMLTLGLIALAVMAVVLAVLFHVRWRLVPLLAVIVGVVWAFALVGWFGIDLSLVTISGLPILIGLGIDFAIQVHNRIEEEVQKDHDADPVGETLANLAPPLIAATLTAVVAFLALRISKVPMIRDFGVLLAIGVVVLFAVGIVVPALVLGRSAAERRDRTRPREGESRVERFVVWIGGAPQKLVVPVIIAAVGVFVAGVLVEGRIKIQSDPIRWVDQGSQTVEDVGKLEDATGFSTTLGVLVKSNNVLDEAVTDLVWDFTLAAEQRPQIVSSSSLANTMGKILMIPEATPIAPTVADVSSAAEVMPPAIRRALLGTAEWTPGDAATATQVNLRVAPGSLEERAVLVAELEADLLQRIEALDLPADSVLLIELPDGQQPVRAVPAGLATVGIGLLENLEANRAALTYLALSLAGVYLMLRLRSLSRTLIALVPVFLAVGVSSLVLALTGIEMSPLTTVSGPLVIASCSEFCVLILGRYIEERQRGLAPPAAADRAASRSGRAFVTSAATTIGGFAVLIASPLPLLRDFGIIVSLNVAIALLAALTVMPPLTVWADHRDLMTIRPRRPDQGDAVRLAAPLEGYHRGFAALGLGLFVAAAIGTYASADTDSGEATQVAYAPATFPTTTTTTTTTTTAPPTTPPVTVPGAPPPTEPAEPAGPLVDPSTFPSEPPTDPIELILFELLTDQGEPPNVANCAVRTLFERVDQPTLLGLGLATLEPAALEHVNQAALDCGISQETVDAAVASYQAG